MSFSVAPRFIYLLLVVLPLNYTFKLSLADEKPSPSICNRKFSCPSTGSFIKYPFWVRSSNDEYICGDEAFEVTCDSISGKPMISVFGDEFHLKNISYDTITVVDPVVEGRTCPRVTHAIDPSQSRGFSIRHDNDSFFTFLFDCPEPTGNENKAVITCLNYTSYVVEDPSFPGGTNNLMNHGCAENVTVLGKRTDERSRDDLGNKFAEVLQSGFILGWNLSDSCLRCEGSNGKCAMETKTETAVCICDHGVVPINKRCARSSGRKKALIIGIVASFTGILLLGGIVIFILIIQRRKKNEQTSYSSRNSSSDPSWKEETKKACEYFGVHLFSFSELQKATNNFDDKREIGDGGFGAVYYGKLRDGRAVAVKRLYESNYKRTEQFMNEVGILAKLNHRHLVTLYGCTSRHSRELLLVYEFIQNGTVSDHLHGHRAKPGAFPWPVRLSIAVETASALVYLHASDIIHRDVKTSNILLDENFRVKVGDFGLSRFFPLDVTHVSTAPQGTPGYLDPEYHQCYQLTEKSDVFSFGVVLVELISSLPAVDITRHRKDINLSHMAIDRIEKRLVGELVDSKIGFESDERVRNQVIAVAELAFQCLQCSKEMRPAMDVVMKTLRGIQGVEETRIQREQGDVLSDDGGLLKFGQVPSSPDSFFAECSSNTTSNTSI